MTSIFDFNQDLLMEDCINKGDMDDLDERNQIVHDILLSFDPKRINAPFPFVQINEADPRYITRRICDETTNIKTGFVHYQLREPDGTRGEKFDPIPLETFKYTIKCLIKNLWCTERPAVHGDLTDSNLIYNPPYLFIKDFEPGLTLYLNTENYIESIETDINDLFNSYRSINEMSYDDFDRTLLPFQERIKRYVINCVGQKPLPEPRFTVPIVPETESRFTVPTIPVYQPRFDISRVQEPQSATTLTDQKRSSSYDIGNSAKRPKYKQKYLKYKFKYLKLKKELEKLY